MPRKPTPATDAAKALAHFLHEPEDLSPSELRSHFSPQDLSIEKLKKRYDALLAQAEGLARLSSASEQRRSFTEKVAKIREQLPSVGNVREYVRQLLSDVFSGGEAQAAVAWRKFEHASDEDLRSMIEDLTLLDELQKDDEA